MSVTKLTTSAAVIASLLAASLSPIAATAASAREAWHGKGGPGYSRSYEGPRHEYRPRHRYDGARYRHHHGSDVAKGLAIGLGVLAVGSILASGAHR